jgi:hypothetical protein
LKTAEVKLVAAVVQERERKLKERLLKEEEERKKKEQPESALHTLDTVVIKRRRVWDNDILYQCCGSGFAVVWLSWIRIRIGYAESDPGARELTKINY